MGRPPGVHEPGGGQPNICLGFVACNLMIPPPARAVKGVL